MTKQTEIKNRFDEIGEYYASGLIEKEDASYFERYSRAHRRYLENCILPNYNNEPLYPCGVIDNDLTVLPNNAFTAFVFYDKLKEKDDECAEYLKESLGKRNIYVPYEHMVGGHMCTHSHPNFIRIIKEGFDSYRDRILNMKDEKLKAGLLDLLDGIKNFHTRALEKVKGNKRLYDALQKVPFKPADTLYEAMVCYNFIYYLDGCDNIGRFDADLIEFYKGEDITDELHCFFKNVDDNNGWSGSIGPDYNPLTIQCLIASKGMRRPSLELRVTEDMPKEVWEVAIDSVSAGGGSPCFYNEKIYQESLQKLFPDIKKQDLMRFSGGGCTETMLAGISNVGSLDAGINYAYILEYVIRQHLPFSKSFEEFYNCFIKECYSVTDIVTKAINDSQKERAEFVPQPMRTLLVDDCIEKEKDFNNGGARYHWSVVNLAGVINVLDSLNVINHTVFKEKLISGQSFVEKLTENDDLLPAKNVTRHGNDDSEVNALANRIYTDICKAFEGKKTYLGGVFIPASIQFISYVDGGRYVGATPDGRKKGDPLGDSIGALNGNDINGVTALLNSAASIPQEKLLGTPVLNIKLNKDHVNGYLSSLIKGYFEKGGMQLQITCINQKDLLEAKEHPEKYGNLVVRVGGYSEYFGRLTPKLQQTVIDRMLHEI